MGGSCCSSPGNDEQFTATTARFVARWHRWFGLARSERRIVEELVARGVGGARVLEIGGGLGQLQLALLDRGAAHATNLDLSSSWEQEAARLAAAEGHADDVTRLVGDAADPPPLEPAEVVVLHRVLCCTDAWRALLDPALSVEPRLVAITLPRDWPPVRAVARVGNAFQRWRDRVYRVRIHDPREVLAHLGAEGAVVVADTHGPAWRTIVLEVTRERAQAA